MCIAVVTAIASFLFNQVAHSAPDKHAELSTYKQNVAVRITKLNDKMINKGNPQPMLRSIVVVKYTVDSLGRLVYSGIVRTNNDFETPTLALNAIRRSAPFPKPPKDLLTDGKLDVLETILFNNDGKFQVRSIATAQLDD